MAKVERFQDLRVWVAARELVKAVYEATALGGLGKDYALRDQMRRAAISVPSNIAEGFSRRSNKEFVQFLFIAKGSAAELRASSIQRMTLAISTEMSSTACLEMLSCYPSSFLD